MILQMWDTVYETLKLKKMVVSYLKLENKQSQIEFTEKSKN